MAKLPEFKVQAANDGLGALRIEGLKAFRSFTVIKGIAVGPTKKALLPFFNRAKKCYK
ncbi:MAG: hypothetical protein QMD09_07970 [Desulfatibacillaceae bacterium]|nr:hypothetical protein [Desulfatibacillaceae bacterium]